LSDLAEPAAPLGTLWVYEPLVWLNRGFDRVTMALGGSGSWMRSQGGRTLLGLAGLALIAVGVVWFLKDWLGWHW
jgi:hypothetical protein